MADKEDDGESSGLPHVRRERGARESPYGWLLIVSIKERLRPPLSLRESRLRSGPQYGWSTPRS